MLIAFEEKFAECPQLVKPPDLLIELRVDDEMEVIVDLVKLCDVLVLHLSAGCALPAGAVGLREAYLVYHDVVNIDLKFG